MQTPAFRSATPPASARLLRPGKLRWLLARAWCLLLGAWLGRALRSALGGGPLPVGGPPVRPRRPGRVRGHSCLPYPHAA